MAHQSDEPRGTFACPICGIGTPHGHREAEIHAKHPRHIEERLRKLSASVVRWDDTPRLRWPALVIAAGYDGPDKWMHLLADDLEFAAEAILNRAPTTPATSQSDEAIITEALTERDEAQEALSQAYYLVTGRSPEWSNLFGVEQAIEEIDEACRLLRAAAKPQAASQSDEALVEEALCAHPCWLRMNDHEREDTRDHIRAIFPALKASARAEGRREGIKEAANVAAQHREKMVSSAFVIEREIRALAEKQP